MFYLVINDEVVYESNHLLDCTDEEELYNTTDIDKVEIWDEERAVIRKAREHEYDETGWVWKPTLSLVK
jgi:hypothetical protein